MKTTTQKTKNKNGIYFSILPTFHYSIKVFLLGVAVLLNANFLFAQNLLWSSKYDGTCGVNGEDIATAITTDGSGNVYTTGYVCGQTYMATVKYNASGTQQWATPYNLGGGIKDMEGGYAIAVDANSNVWVAAATYYNSTYNTDLALFKYNSNGSIQTNYPKFYHDISGLAFNTWPDWPKGASIAVYNSTNVYIAGTTYDSVNTIWKLIVLKDSSNSGWGWNNTPYVKQGTGIYAHAATDLKVNRNNTSLWVTGYINNLNTGYDWYTAKLNPVNGAKIWDAQYNGTNTDRPYALTYDGNENVYVAGYAYDPQNLNHGSDGLLIKYNSNGAQQWTAPYNNATYNLDEVWHDIAIKEASGNATDIMVGGFIGKGTGANFNDDYLLANYTSSGSLTTNWSPNPITYDAPGTPPESYQTDWIRSVRYSISTNIVYVTGSVTDTLNGTNTIDIGSRGYNVANGSNVWSRTYDYGGDKVIGDDFTRFNYTRTFATKVKNIRNKQADVEKIKSGREIARAK